MIKEQISKINERISEIFDEENKITPNFVLEVAAALEDLDVSANGRGKKNEG